MFFAVVAVFQVKFYLLGSFISHTLLGDQHTIDYYEIFSPSNPEAICLIF